MRTGTCRCRRDRSGHERRWSKSRPHRRRPGVTSLSRGDRPWSRSSPHRTRQGAGPPPAGRRRWPRDAGPMTLGAAMGLRSAAGPAQPPRGASADDTRRSSRVRRGRGRMRCRWLPARTSTQRLGPATRGSSPKRGATQQLLANHWLAATARRCSTPRAASPSADADRRGPEARGRVPDTRTGPAGERLVAVDDRSGSGRRYTV